MDVINQEPFNPLQPPLISNVEKNKPSRKVINLLMFLLIIVITLTLVITYLKMGGANGPVPTVSTTANKSFSALLKTSSDGAEATEYKSTTIGWKILNTAWFTVKIPSQYSFNQVTDNGFIISPPAAYKSYSAITITVGLPNSAGYDKTIQDAKGNQASVLKNLSHGIEFTTPKDSLLGGSRVAVYKYNEQAIISSLITDGVSPQILDDFDLISETLVPKDVNPEYCEVNKEYSSDSSHPLTCICRIGQKQTRVSLTSKPCDDGSGSCPISVWKCTE